MLFYFSEINVINSNNYIVKLEVQFKYGKILHDKNNSEMYALKRKGDWLIIILHKKRRFYTIYFITGFI